MKEITFCDGKYTVRIDLLDYERLLEYKHLDEDDQVAVEYYFYKKYLWNCLMFDEVYSSIE